MAVKSEKAFRSFIKGLVTEANELTFPEGASIDEDNFVLQRDGLRSRRLGVDYENLYELTATGYTDAQIASGKQSFFKWDSPGGDTTVSLGIIRINEKLWFVNLLTANPSDNLMNSGSPITISGLSNSSIEVAIISNKCVLVSEDLSKPVLLNYNSVTDTITQSTLDVKVRDIWGVDDGIATDTRPGSLSAYHKYNLRNQGWATTIETTSGTYPDAIEYCKNNTTFGNVYPSNSDSWTLGKNSNPADGNYEKFDPAILKKNSQSNYQVARGSFILDAFNRGTSRMSESDVSTGLTLDQETGTITTVTSYAQRIFYAGINSSITGSHARSPNYNNYIFFTRVVREDSDLQKCYQEADPTDPGINDLIASDGGTIQIPEITRIIKIIGGQSSLLVFAENGVWEVYGDTGGFYATSFQVSKISTNGVLNQRSIIEVGGNFVYWSKSGIYSLTTEAASGRFKPENISLKTIQKFYLNIPFLGKKYAKGFYDEKENRIRWLYNDSASYSETNYVNKYTKELIYDLTLEAFYTHSISDLASNSPYIADFIDIPNYVTGTLDTNITVGTNQVIVTSGTDVVVTIDIESNRTSQFGFLTIVGTSFTISKYQNTKFLDWETKDATGITYNSYLITGYENFGDLLKRKQTPYVTFYFQRTEDGYTDSSGTLELTKPSSCKVQAQWNWANSSNSGKWGTEFQAYRLLRNYIPSGPLDTFNYGDSVIVTKNKVRGSGKVLSLKITSEDQKDMKILGWGMPVIKSDVV